MRIQRSFLLVVACCCLLTTRLCAGDTPLKARVAVLDFSNRAGLDNREVDYLSQVARGAARENLAKDAYIIMTRDNIMELLPPGVTLSDCIGECAVETARNIGADFVIAGEVILFGGELRMSMTLHETRLGDLMSSAQFGADDILNLEATQRLKVAELLASMSDIPAPARSEPAIDFEDLWPLTNSADMRMIPIMAGRARIGSPVTESGRDQDEFPHDVVISRPLYASETEVTCHQWTRVMGGNVGDHRDNYPVVKITWIGALQFCNRLSNLERLQPVYTLLGDKALQDRNANGYRLPTESEWEYMCRAGTDTRYGFADGDADLPDYALFSRNAIMGTEFGDVNRSVAQKKPNNWALYDMHGGVWEWCWDIYDDYQPGEELDPQGAEYGLERVIRGGSFRCIHTTCRCANRDRMDPAGAADDVGFRVVRNP